MRFSMFVAKPCLWSLVNTLGTNLGGWLATFRTRNHRRIVASKNSDAFTRTLPFGDDFEREFGCGTEIILMSKLAAQRKYVT